MFSRGSTRVRNRRRDSAPSLWRQIFLGIGLCLFVSLVLFGVWHLTRVPALTITDVRVEGGETISHETIENLVNEELSGTYVKLIPHTFIPLYPKEAIETSVRTLPRVKNASLFRDGTSLTVTFVEYIPFALWCLSHDETTCFFLDEAGFAFAPGPHLEGGAFVRHLIESESELKERQLFSQNVFQATHAFLNRLEETLKLRVTDVVYTQEGDITLRVNGGGEILLKNDGAYDSVYKNLESILASNEFDHLEPGNFKYIDLRFGNKIFVNEDLEPEPVATSTASTTDEGGV